MNKLEKKFIKFTFKKILDVIESTEYKYLCFAPDEWSSYGLSQLKEERYNEIQYFIDRAKDRGVNENVIAQWQHLNYIIWLNNI